MISITCQTGASVEVDEQTLRGAKLNGLNLHRAIFEGNDLTDAVFADADLRGALFTGAVLKKKSANFMKLGQLNNLTSNLYLNPKD